MEPTHRHAARPGHAPPGWLASRRDALAAAVRDRPWPGWAVFLVNAVLAAACWVLVFLVLYGAGVVGKAILSAIGPAAPWVDP